jgi:hypothetical protein
MEVIFSFFVRLFVGTAELLVQGNEPGSVQVIIIAEVL